jgi:hypothetical protein
MFGAYGFETRLYLGQTREFLFNGKTVPVLMVCAGVFLLVHSIRKPSIHESESANAGR